MLFLQVCTPLRLCCWCTSGNGNGDGCLVTLTCSLEQAKDCTKTRSESAQRKKKASEQKPVAGEAKNTHRLKTLVFANELCVLHADATKPDNSTYANRMSQNAGFKHFNIRNPLIFAKHVSCILYGLRSTKPRFLSKTRSRNHPAR